MYLAMFDPGHTKTNKNRSPDGSYLEWEFTQEVADVAYAMVRHIPGLNAQKTKEADDVAVPGESFLVRRTDAANNANADVFISIHSNASGSTWGNATGWNIYRYPGRNLKLAQVAYKNCLELLPLSHWGTPIREANFHVLRETKMPSVLIEFAFHTHKGDVELLKTREFRVQCAKVCVKTACDFLGVQYVEGVDGMTPKHIVVRGDNNWKIARDNGLTVAQLAEFNPHIPDMSLIYAEHGGDVVYLGPPTPFEVEYGILRRALILSLKQNDRDKVDLKVVADQLKATTLEKAKAQGEVLKLKDSGRHLIQCTTEKLGSYAPIFE